MDANLKYIAPLTGNFVAHGVIQKLEIEDIANSISRASNRMNVQATALSQTLAAMNGCHGHEMLAEQAEKWRIIYSEYNRLAMAVNSIRVEKSEQEHLAYSFYGKAKLIMMVLPIIIFATIYNALGGTDLHFRILYKYGSFGLAIVVSGVALYTLLHEGCKNGRNVILRSLLFIAALFLGYELFILLISFVRQYV